MKIIFWGLGSLVLAFLLSGCFPVKETFFQPEAEEGEVLGKFCRGSTGPPSIIRFQYEGVNIGAHTYKKHDKSSLSIAIDSAFPYKAGVPTTRFTFEAKGKKGVLKLNRVYQIGRTPNITDILIKDHLLLEGYKGAAYVLDFALDIQKAELFTLFIPPLTINGHETTFPPIKWSLTSGVYVAPLNC